MLNTLRTHISEVAEQQTSIVKSRHFYRDIEAVMLSAPPNRIENLLRDVDKRCGFTLKASNTALISYHHQSTLSGVSGSGTVSSSDGQRFGIQKHSLLASFYPRYFGYYDRAVSVYTHISDQLSAFSTRVISCGRAALYVLDGLLENDSVLRLREHSTDTHGYIEDLFGLCNLLGYSFMPRIRDLADQQLYRIDRDAVYPNLAGIFRGGVDVRRL